ncbi:MAG: PAS domain-containing sensor histidine kinase [Candidatus Coatesbacteria bacterium]|nr:PAS domain-containing sensor histidine kinase [Candidatus Coatesbacteria bacterium]
MPIEENMSDIKSNSWIEVSTDPIWGVSETDNSMDLFNSAFFHLLFFLSVFDKEEIPNENLRKRLLNETEQFTGVFSKGSFLITGKFTPMYNQDGYRFWTIHLFPELPSYLITNALTNVDHGVAIIDSDGKIVYLNRYFAKIHGKRLDELIGKGLPWLFKGKEKSFFKALDEAKEKEFFQMEIERTRDDGLSFWSIFSIKQIGIVKATYFLCLVYDTTLLRQTASALDYSTLRYHNLVEHINDGYFVIQDNKIIDVNKAFLEIFEYEYKDLDKIKITQLATTSYKKKLVNSYKRKLKDFNGTPSIYSFEIKTGNGSIKMVETNVGMIEFEGKKTIIGTIRDITEKIEIEKKLAENAKHLEEQVEERTLMLKNTLTSLEKANNDLKEIISVISHDIKSPVIALQGFLQLIKVQHLNKDYPYYKELVTSTDKLSDLLQDLFSIAIIGRYEDKKEWIDLKKMIPEVIVLLEQTLPSLREFITVELSISRLYISEKRLFQLLSNLINNAYKFSKTINEPRIFLKIYEENDLYCLSVEDNGPNIPFSMIDKAFSIFGRLHANNVEGTGAGLAIVKKIIDNWNGKIEVETSELGGLRITLKWNKLKHHKMLH